MALSAEPDTLICELTRGFTPYPTVRHAMTTLRERGLIVSLRGRETFVVSESEGRKAASLPGRMARSPGKRDIP